jgi:glycerol kinase
MLKMQEKAILALDQGTTSTRAIVFDIQGRALAEASRPLRQSYPRDGWVEHDAEEIWTACAAVLREAVERSGRGAADIAALGITNQRETIVIWDRATGRPIHPAIVWQDRRTAAECEAMVAEGIEPSVTAVTGLLLDPYFSATKIAWLLDNVPGARSKAEQGELLAGTMDCWAIWNLTGGKVHATDATNASRTLLFDINSQTWSPEMLKLFNVPECLLPQVRDCSDDYGVMIADILGEETPIRGVAGDQQAALMGQGCIRPGEMKTFGTGCFMLLNTGLVRPASKARLLTTVAARLSGVTTYALEGSIFVAGAAIQWLGEGLGLTGGPRAAEALAQTARPGHGVMLVPAFTGLGAPWWDAEARGALFGLTRDTGLAEIAAATFDACAYQTRDLIEAMKADAPDAFGEEAELRIDGGMSQSGWFSQRLADLTALPVFRVSYQETTALGAALFAGLGAGLFTSLEAAAAARPDGERLVPSDADVLREAGYSRWLNVVGRTRS